MQFVIFDYILLFGVFNGIFMDFLFYHIENDMYAQSKLTQVILLFSQPESNMRGLKLVFLRQHSYHNIELKSI